MNCPYCKNSTKVTNSRSRAQGTQIWRRRTCKNCAQVWTTLESIDLSTSHRVSGLNNGLEPFSRDELFSSIKDSLQHRKTALSDATALTDTVLARILLQNQAIIPKSEVIAVTSDVLKKFDKVAAAVYAAKHSA